MNVTLTQISKRLLLRYYPLWLLINILMSYNLVRVLRWMPGVKIGQNIIGGQLVNILMYLFIITPLYIFKPSGFLRRLVVMISAMFVAVLLFHLLTVAAYANHPEVFGGHVVPPQLILFQTVIGFFIIWFFVLAERSLIAEEDLAKKETKRLSYEKQLLEDRLVLLQAQMEPLLLLRTMKKIEGLYGTDPQKATTMQMHFIQHLRALLVKTRGRATTVEQEMALIRAFIALYIIKPYNIPVRIFVMAASMLLSVSLSILIICWSNNLPPIPFSGIDQVTSLFIGYFTSGICIIWFLSIEEKQYAAEKKIASERLKIAMRF